MYFLASEGVRTFPFWSDSVKLKLLETFSEALMNLHLGQGLDLALPLVDPNGVEESEYLEMVAGKTAALLTLAAGICILEEI